LSNSVKNSLISNGASKEKDEEGKGGRKKKGKKERQRGEKSLIVAPPLIRLILSFYPGRSGILVPVNGGEKRVGK